MFICTWVHQLMRFISSLSVSILQQKNHQLAKTNIFCSCRKEGCAIFVPLFLYFYFIITQTKTQHSNEDSLLLKETFDKNYCQSKIFIQ